jgi:hypothetical protein
MVQEMCSLKEVEGMVQSKASFSLQAEKELTQ